MADEPAAEPPRWASLAEAEVYSRVPRRTLRRWIKQGRLPATRYGPRRIEVDLNDLDRLRAPIHPVISTGGEQTA